MANWEYKVLSSGKHGMASMAALEQHLNDLGQQQWEIINWHTAPDNPLLFTGLARRPILRDWKPDEMPAAQEAARQEKAAEEAAHERDAWRETIKEELEFLSDRDEDESDPTADREELLDLLRAQLKRSQRGPGFVGSIGFLARKLEQDENDLLGALAEIGLTLTEDPHAAPSYLDHDDEYYWLSRNQRDEIWLNCGPRAPIAKQKPEQRHERRPAPPTQPFPKEVAQSEVQPEPTPEAPEQQAADQVQPPPTAPVAPHVREQRHEQPQRERGHREQPPAAPLPEGETLLTKLRPMMRRNRRGRGWSGSTSFLCRALRHQEAELMAALARSGLVLGNDPQAKPVFVEINGFLYWLNRGQGGQIWINAREKQPGEPFGGPEDAESGTGATPAPEHAPAEFVSTTETPIGATGEPVAATESVNGAEAPPTFEQPVAEQPAIQQPPADLPPTEPAAVASSVEIPAEEPVPAEVLQSGQEVDSAPEPQPAPVDDGSLWSRIRPHFTKNKRGNSYSAAPGALAEALGMPQLDLVEALVKAGLQVPEREDDKPVFAEHAGEIFWFNRNAKDELWLNSKPKPARRAAASRPSRGRRSA
jgi:hypothetical protein